MAVETSGMVRACSLDELRREGMRVATVGGRTVLLIAHEGRVAALDNRCPHMGFPLRRGSVKDGLLTCHWHHAKFDLASGCTLDLFADDAQLHEVEVRDGDVWLDPRPMARDQRSYWLERLDSGLRHNLSLGLAKSAIGLVRAGAVEEAVSEAARFGLRYRCAGWSPGLTVLVAGARVLPHLDEADRPLALYHGLIHVADDTSGQAPLFAVAALEAGGRERGRYREWFRDFVEVREQEAAERALATAVGELKPPQVAELVFAAATDHRYLNGGHALDHANKAFELLELIGWEHAAETLASVVPILVGAQRMEESSSWRHPLDVAALVREAGAELVALPAVEAREWSGHLELAERILEGEPGETMETMLRLLRSGVPAAELSSAVALAGSLRAVHFPVSNELSDWETVLHGFTYANAVDQAVRRSGSSLVARGMLDAAAAIWLERFLNVPSRAVPRPTGEEAGGEAILNALDTQGQVDRVGQLVVDALAAGRRDEVIRALGHALYREDTTFHQAQMYEATLRQLGQLDAQAGDLLLLGCARYLAAHYPTPRGRGQTYDIALRLQRGEALYEDVDTV